MDNEAKEQQYHNQVHNGVNLGENKRQLLRYQDQSKVSYNRFKLFKSKDKVSRNIDKANSP